MINLNEKLIEAIDGSTVDSSVKYTFMLPLIKGINDSLTHNFATNQVDYATQLARKGPYMLMNAFSATSGLANLAGNIAEKSIEFCNSEGKKAKIKFDGEEIVYEGDLPIHVSAKMLFESIFQMWKNA